MFYMAFSTLKALLPYFYCCLITAITTTVYGLHNLKNEVKNYIFEKSIIFKLLKINITYMLAYSVLLISKLYK